LELKELRDQLKKAEEHITKLESDKLQLEHKLSDPGVYGNPDLLQEASQAFNENQQQLEQLNEEWEEIASKLDKIEQPLSR
jgi:ATP-binding cassette subfamily F protein 3